MADGYLLFKKYNKGETVKILLYCNNFNEKVYMFFTITKTTIGTFLSSIWDKIIEFILSTPVQIIAYSIIMAALFYVLSKEERQWLQAYIKAVKTGSNNPIADATAATEEKESNNSDIIKTVYYIPGLICITIPRYSETGKIAWDWDGDCE